MLGFSIILCSFAAFPAQALDKQAESYGNLFLRDQVRDTLSNLDGQLEKDMNFLPSYDRELDCSRLESIRSSREHSAKALREVLADLSLESPFENENAQKDTLDRLKGLVQHFEELRAFERANTEKCRIQPEKVGRLYLSFGIGRLNAFQTKVRAFLQLTRSAEEGYKRRVAQESAKSVTTAVAVAPPQIQQVEKISGLLKTIKFDESKFGAPGKKIQEIFPQRAEIPALAPQAAPVTTDAE